MYSPASKGATLIDTVVATGLLLIVFVGITAAFRLSVEVVTNNKARAGAIALANERLEFVRSLPYDSIGTSGGIPAGTLLQSEDVTLNGIRYVRRTVVLYVDDPRDGSGGADSNGVTADFKTVKAEVSWFAKNGGVRKVVLVTRVSPIGIEQAVPGGTLSLAIIDAASQPVVGAQVLIVNTLTTPPINTTLFSDEDGMVIIPGAPESSGYEITVTRAGYTTARTYAADATNTNPSPGHLTVALNQTTSSTFSIDAIATKNIRTYTPIETQQWSDTFSSATEIAEQSGVNVTSGSVFLAGDPGDYTTAGTVRSVAIASATGIRAWTEADWSDTRPASTDVRYRIYSGDGTELVPDGQLPGNSTGFSVPPIDLSGVSTSTYQALSLHASLSTGDINETPALHSWNITYDTGPIPLPDLEFSVRGTKTIGSGPAGQILLYSTTTTSGASAGVNLANLVWDAYTITVAPATGYAIASVCSPQPQGLAPNEYQTTDVIVAPHTPHSLLVDVRNSGGALIPGASVRLYRTGTDETESTDGCGQVFFSGIGEGTTGGGDAYSITVTAGGYTTYNASDVSVSGVTRLSILLD